MLVQHLLHPGSRGGGDRGGPHGHARGAVRRAGLRLEGRDPRGLLVVHRAGAALARRRRAEHAPRRRRRRHAAGAPGQGVRGQGRGSRRRERRLGGGAGHPRRAPPLAARGPEALDHDRRRDQGRDRGDHHRRPPALPARREGRAAVPGDQRQRLRHQVEVRQPLRRPPLADRRHQPRHRRDDRRQAGRGLRLRRRGQGLRRVAARPGRPGGGHRDRPDLRASGRHAGLPGGHARRRGRERRHLHHRHRQQGHHHRRPTWPA